MFICYLGSSAFDQTIGDEFNSGVEIAPKFPVVSFYRLPDNHFFDPCNLYSSG